MAMVVDNQKQQHQMVVVEMQQSPSPSPLLPPLPPSPQAYKYYCRVCKKGFMCGRALGGHMRAHGISDDGLGAGDALDDDSGAGDPWDMGSPSGGTKRMYALRTNPNRLKICRVCQNCGKEFMSWKLFLEHGKCNSDEVDNADGSLHSSPPSEVDGEEDTALAAGWSKGKRSRRSKMMVVGTVSLSPLPLLSLSSEEEDLANCLVMLSSSRADIVDTDQESCASASKENDRRPPLPQPISFMAPETERAKVPSPVVAQPVSTAPRGMFECKACKKVFTSHQALGGHRASHKKVKGCFATKLENDLNESLHPVATAAPHDNANAAANVHANTSEDAKTSAAKANTDGKTNAGTSSDASAAAATLAMAIVPVDNPSAPATVSPFKKKAKLHECSICHRVFTSGQALGGHKRCHWLTSSTMDPIGPVTKLQSFAQDQVNAICHQLTVRPVLDTSEPALDLNIPANPTPQVAAARRAELSGSPLRLDVPASVYLQSWTAHSNANHRNKAATSSHNDVTGDVAEDEADSTNVKRAKLSDLKDMNMVGESSSWLQVGIGSSPGKSAQE